MFIALTIRAQDGTIFHELVNIAHISSVAFRNIKNVDEGVVIKMKNNDWFYTDECMDQFAVRLKNAWMEAASLLLHQIEMELHTEPPATPKRKKQPVKRKTTTRKK
jgi:hypothetical protein